MRRTSRVQSGQLSAGEERRLLRAACAGDSAAALQLVRASEGLIRSVVRRFRGYSDQDDLMQAGIIGLLTAISRFDLRRTVRLSTFSLPHILGEIRRQARFGSDPRVTPVAPEDTDLEQTDPAATLADRVAVREAVRRLPPMERQLVLWRYYCERSQVETAGLLGISQAQVSRLERTARNRMSDMLGEGESKKREGEC